MIRMVSRAAIPAAIVALLLGTAGGARAGVVVPTQHNDNFRTGANLEETVLTPATVMRHGMRRVDRSVDGPINTQILYAHGVAAGGGARNVAYVTTSTNSVYAFDADDRSQAAQGGLLWRRTLADPSASPPAIARGINATPVLEFADGKGTIDVLYSTANQFPWNSIGIVDELLMLKTLEVHYYLVKLDLATGATVLGPVEVQGSMQRSDGQTMRFVPRNESDTASLLLDHGYLYASFSARQNENVSQYYGWMIRYDASNLAYAGAFNTVPYAWAWQPATHPSPVAVSSGFVCYQPVGGRLEWWRFDWLVPLVPLQMACVGEGGGIWQGGAGPAADRDGNVYVMIGNGHYETASGSYGDSIVKLHSTGPGTTPDAFGLTASYSPPNERDQDETFDVDLGSAGPMVVDGAKRVVAGGKTGIFYVVDDRLAQVQRIVAGVDHRAVDWSGHLRYQTWNQGPHLHGSPTFWRTSVHSGYVYEWAEKDYLKKYKFDIDRGRFVVRDSVRHPWVAQAAILAAACDKLLCLNAMPGGMLAISANDTKESTGIVWAILRQYDSSSADSIYAFDARTLKRIWSDAIGAVPHFAGPTVADGHVFVPTNSAQWRFTIYSLGAAQAATTRTSAAARGWPTTRLAGELAMARMMPMHTASPKGGVPDYATDPAFQARLALPKLMKSLPAGTIVGAIYAVAGNEVYQCTTAACTRTRSDILHAYHYDDRPGTDAGVEIPHAACSYTKTLAEISPFGTAADWQLLTFAPDQCPVFGSRTSLVERTWTHRGAPPSKPTAGEHVVPFVALYVVLRPGK
jgi:hypothetical protein